MSDEIIINVVYPLLSGLGGIGLGALSLMLKWKWQDYKRGRK